MPGFPKCSGDDAFAPARRAYQASKSDAERSALLAAASAKSARERLVLSGDERRDLAAAYKLLDRIHARHKDKLDRPADGDESETRDGGQKDAPGQRNRAR